MKIDLDETERKAREAPGGCCYACYYTTGGDPSCNVTALALIAYIRELQAALLDPELSWRAVGDIIDKGAVVP